MVPGVDLGQNLGLGRIVVAPQLPVLYAESIAPERDIADCRLLGWATPSIYEYVGGGGRNNGTGLTWVWAPIRVWDI